MDAATYMKEMGERHEGILTADEGKVLSEAEIGVAGVGGVGGWTCLSLARLGCRRFRLADPGLFDPPDANRQAGGCFETMERNKAEVLAEEILRILPAAEVSTWSDGLTVESAKRFVRGTDLVVDGVDLFELDVKKRLFDAAREEGIPVVSTPILGYGAAIGIFHPSRSPRFEEYFGTPPARSNKMAYARYVRRLAAGFFGFKPKLNWPVVNGRIDEGKIPSIGTSCLLAGSLATVGVIDTLLGKGTFPQIPESIHIDLMERKIVRTGRLKRLLLRFYARYLLK
jgi:sulfur-carrier protein adenylyltransferase/sulfurtransferase